MLELKVGMRFTYDGVEYIITSISFTDKTQARLNVVAISIPEARRRRDNLSALLNGEIREDAKRGPAQGPWIREP